MRIRFIKLIMTVVAMAGALTSGSASAMEEYVSAANCTPLLEGSQSVHPSTSGGGQHLAGAVWEPTRGWSNMHSGYGMFVFCPIPALFSKLPVRELSITIDTFGGTSSSASTVSVMSVNNSGGTRTWGSATVGQGMRSTTFGLNAVPDANINDYFFIKVMVSNYKGGGSEPSSLRGIHFSGN